MNIRKLLPIAVLLILPGSAALAQDNSGIDPEALIDRILAADRAQHDQIRDVVFEAEYVEREDKGDEGSREKIRFVKKIYLKYVEDTCLFAEEYLEYYKEGELQSDKDLQKEAKDRMEKKRKRKTRDLSYPMLRPFHPERRELYEITYLGVADEQINDFVCHRFRVKALEEADTLINGDFYFEAETFHLVRADFSPAKLVKKTMFKLKELNMSLWFAPNSDGFWFPRQFDIAGKGKAAFFFGVNFAGTEYYRNPVINSGLDDKIFEVQNGD